MSLNVILVRLNEPRGDALKKLSDIDLRLLEVFVTVVERGGFTAAQSDLGVDLSTISNHMAALEERLGVKLCERGRSGFRLTEQGRVIYTATQRLAGSISDFRAEAGSLRNTLTGDLNVGVVDGLNALVDQPVAEALSEFMKRKNEVRFHLVVTMPQELNWQIRDGQLHVAITTVHSQKLSRLSYQPIFVERYNVFCSNRHPLYNRPDNALAPSDLSSCPAVAHGYWKLSDEPLIQWREAAAASVLEAQLHLILSGCYLGFLPSYFAEPYVAKGILKPLLPLVVKRENILYLIVRRDVPLTRTVSAFVEDVSAAFRRMNERLREMGSIAHGKVYSRISAGS